jgi:hypothetical protein
MGRNKDRDPAAPPLRKYCVTYVTARTDTETKTSTVEVEAHFAFDNIDNSIKGRGLVFRRYNDDSDIDSKTYVVAEFRDYVMYRETK